MRELSLNQHILPALFIAAVFSLIWRDGLAALKPFEAIVGTILILVAYRTFFSADGRSDLLKLKPILIRFGLLFGAFLLFVVIGHWSGTFSFPGWSTYSTEAYLEYARIIFAFLVFFISVYMAVNYRQSAQWILGAVALSPVLLFFAFYPRWQGFFVDNARLIGARNDPNYLATFLALGLIISAVYFLYSNSGKRWFGILYIALFSPFFVWAQSRAAFLSFALALIILSAVYFFRNPSAKRAVSLGMLGIAFVLSMSLSFFLLPNTSRLYIFQRNINPVLSNGSLREFIVDRISEGDEGFRAAASKDIDADDFGYSRGALWGEGLSEALDSPLGYGPAYHNWSPIGDVGRPHSLWLEVALTAGWGGIALLFLIIGDVFKKAVRTLSDGGIISNSLFFGFLYLLLNSFFLDMLTLRWLWLIMGLIVGYHFLNEHENAESLGSAADT